MAIARSRSSMSQLFQTEKLQYDWERPFQEMLSAIRSHLGMDVAFISEFTDGLRVFRHVDSLYPDQPVMVGGFDPLDQSYCQRIVDGRFPELMNDACSLPAALEMPVTRALPVGAHLSVPIRLSGGRVYGTLCCFSFKPDHSLTDRDLSMLRVISEIVSHQIERDQALRHNHEDIERRIAAVMGSDQPSIVYQPIHDIVSDTVVGYEALARFSQAPPRPPDAWFAEAASIGRGLELESKTIHRALSGFMTLKPDTYVSINLSAESILSGHIADILEGRPLQRIVLEITEHSSVSSYAEISRATRHLRRRGLRLAVDDAGAGYASFRHILALRPDLIKLDMSLTRNIDADFGKKALATALVSFAFDTGSKIIAEGVETQAELDTLRSLRVSYAQGYLLGRPAPLSHHLSQEGPPIRSDLTG